MRDFEIRTRLKTSILKKYYSDINSKVVEELNLPVAKARIDLAVINGYLHGFEIKSASDTLQRLPSQLIAYSKVFDYLSIITEDKYHHKVINILPDWVGIYVCSEIKGEFKIKEIKKAILNKNIEGFYLAKLLWREELIGVLNQFNIHFRIKERNWILAETIAKNIELDVLSDIVRKKLKERITWKPS